MDLVLLNSSRDYTLTFTFQTSPKHIKNCKNSKIYESNGTQNSSPTALQPPSTHTPIPSKPINVKSKQATKKTTVEPKPYEGRRGRIIYNN